MLSVPLAATWVAGETRTVDVVERVWGVLQTHPAVQDITLVGSRARGSATRFSDWDLLVDTDDFEQLASALPELVAALDPLASLWDPITGGEACYMLIFEGPTKVDLIFEHPRANDPPWTVSVETLDAVDEHFWDWTLWLCAKQAAGKEDLVTAELHKMFQHLLQPMGAAEVPASLPEAVGVYERLRAGFEDRFGVVVSRRLGEAVAPVVASVSSSGASVACDDDSPKHEEVG